MTGVVARSEERGGPLLVGVDVGTTTTKAGVVDLDGRLVAESSVPTVWKRVPTGAEARPADFVDAVVESVSRVLAVAPQGPVVGAGVTSMAETAVLLDARGTPIGPAVAWYDQRARVDYDDLAAEMTLGEFGHHTGLARGGEVPTVITLRWLMTHHSELRRAERVLSVAEWVVHALGGVVAAEASLASRTGALAVTRRAWWPEVIGWAGVARSLFPELRPSGGSWGRAASLPGLERLAGAALTVAGHDHLVASVGCGVTSEKQLVDSCGTAEALLRPVPATAEVDPGAGIALGVCTGWHVIPGYYNLIVGLRLGIDLMAVLDELGVSASHGQSPLDAIALDITNGVTSPDQAGYASLRWLAVLENSVAAVAKTAIQIEQLSGPVQEVLVTGGWAANPVLRRLKAGVFPRATYPVVAEAGIRGAALLAGLAAGVYPEVAAFPPPPLEKEDLPL